MAERKYLVQRIEWVTTGWKGPCRDFKEKVPCNMSNPEEERQYSIKKNLPECSGCTEKNAFSKWKWAFNPPMKAPKELNRNDIILIISRNPNDEKYYCVGLAVVKKYKKTCGKKGVYNTLECDENTSIAFAFQDGLVEYAYGKKGFPETGQACHTTIKKDKLTKLLEVIKKKHKEIDKEDIANKLDKVIKLIGNDEQKQVSNNKQNLINIINAIDTKPFIILSGISGTGKTQIARIISTAIVSDNKSK